MRGIQRGCGLPSGWVDGQGGTATPEPAAIVYGSTVLRLYGSTVLGLPRQHSRCAGKYVNLNPWIGL